MKKTFLEYLFENDNLNEAAFAYADFFKKNDNYLKQLIDVILNTHTIKAGINKDNIVDIDVPDDVLQQIQDYASNVDYSNLTDDDLDRFNSILMQLKGVKTPSGRDTDLQWTKIWKGQFSEQGKNLKGGQNAKLAEAAVAYCYNEMHNANESDVEFDDKQLNAKVDQKLKNVGMQDNWIKSSKITAKKIDVETKKNNVNYVAAHVDGNDISKIPNSISEIAKIFTGKEGIKHVFKNKVDYAACDALYPGKQKDVWNKADIVLVSDSFDIQKALDSYLTFNNVSALLSAEEINNFINSLIDQKQIVPLSLKGIVIKKDTTLNDIAYEIDGKLAKSTELNEIDTVEICLPGEIKEPDKKIYNGSCYLRTNNNLQLTFRNKEWQKETLLIEIQLKGARGGNGLALIQNKLNLTTGFYKDILDELGIKYEDQYLAKIRELTGQELDVPQKLKDATKDTKNPWFKRTAYKAMLAFMLKYRDKIQKSKNKVDLVNMFRLLYNCASGANSDSIYWLVKTK